MTKDPSRVARALMGEKSPEEIAVERAIFSGVRKWTGEQASSESGIPIRRGDKIVYRHNTVLSGFDGNMFSRLMQASQLRTAGHLRRRAKTIKECLSSIRTAASMFDQLDIEAKIGSWPQISSGALECRVISAMGSWVAFPAAAQSVIESLETQLKQLDTEISSLRSGPGRPVDRAARQVAMELAKFYVEVTGKKPTYAEDGDGQYGDYTPVLKNVFIALGWEKLTLSGPAKAAVGEITDEYICSTSPPALFPFGSSIFQGPTA